MLSSQPIRRPIMYPLSPFAYGRFLCRPFLSFSIADCTFNKAFDPYTALEPFPLQNGSPGIETFKPFKLLLGGTDFWGGRVAILEELPSCVIFLLLCFGLLKIIEPPRGSLPSSGDRSGTPRPTSLSLIAFRITNFGPSCRPHSFFLLLSAHSKEAISSSILSKKAAYNSCLSSLASASLSYTNSLVGPIGSLASTVFVARKVLTVMVRLFALIYRALPVYVG